MAKALWNQDITKKTDWGGDDSTGGQAVSGKYVQKFIKETLNKKFGYIHYHEKKYYVFSDKEDFNLWNASEANHVTYQNLVLATFDAPQPASIKVGIVSGEDYASEFETMLFGKKLKPLKFTYYIEDNSKNPVAESVILRVTVTSRTTGSVKSDVITLPIDLQHYKDEDEDHNKIGIAYEYTRLENLITSPDNYDIILTITGVTTQVSATLAYSLQLVEINISSNFNNLVGVEYNKRMFSQNLTITGAATLDKVLNVYIDGQPLYQDYVKLSSRKDLTISSGQVIGSDNRLRPELVIYMSRYANPDDTSSVLVPVTWEAAPDPDPNIMEQVDPDFIGKEIFSPGKHTLQLNTYIIVDGNKISSKTLFYEFVVSDPNVESTYLLYKSEVDNTQVSGENIEINGQQYSPITFSVGVYDTRGRDVSIKYSFYKENDDNNWEFITDLNHTVQSGTDDNVTYTLRDAGNLKLDITSPSATDTLTIYIKSANSGVVISEVTENNRYRYSAENRSRTEDNAMFWPNTSDKYGDNVAFDKQGVLNNIILNDNNGWNNNALVLQNNATVTFPFNLFNMPIEGKDYDMTTDGFTFEIDFETMNVQDDDATILSFTDDENNSYLKICATSAELCSMGGTKIKTNFKEGERIKLAFIINPLAELYNGITYKGMDLTHPEDDPSTDENPNTLFIMVNGVLDRVVKYGTGRPGSDSFKWSNPQGPNKNSFTIGNTTGKCGIKLYSIRIYDRYLTLDEEFMNYMNDQSGDKLLALYRKNNIVSATGEISFEECKKVMPTMVMSTDYESFGSFDATRKKDNTFAEVQFFDPENKELNFYARQCWVSCQGTSSMSYPIKNLRLYFGKTTNSKTFQYKNQIEIKDINGQYELKDIPAAINSPEHLETKPEYETEFWPFSEYGENNETTVAAWADTVLPYSTNKKADSTDGSAILVGGEYLTAVHDGYHKIGANRTIKGKASLIRAYMNLTEYDATSIDDNGRPASVQVQIYRVKAGAEPKLIKDAFDNKYIVYSTPGMEGYIGTGTASSINNATWGDVYYYDAKDKSVSSISVDLFEDCTMEVKVNSIGESGETVEKFLEHDDLFISAYRPLLRNGETVLDESYKRYIYELRYSGVKFFTKKVKKIKQKDENGQDIEVKATYPNGNYVWEYKKVKEIEDGVLYYSLGSNWRQYNGLNGTHNSGWTDRWTLKADYAESSMTHNAGVGRLWGDAMYNVKLDGLGNACQTKAQTSVAKLQYPIDIRTSCDGKPIVLFYRQISNFDEEGKPVYGDIKFAGLYNIMTDKSSTKLFGFEDIKDENNKTVFSADDTECWECLNNGSGIIKGITTAFDEKDKNGNTAGNVEKKSKLGEDRSLWGTYEARWPDTGQERHEYNPVSNPLGNNWPDDTYGVDTKNLEGFLRWVNFTQYALDYTIGKNGEMDGYKQDLYKLVSDVTTAYNHWTAFQTAQNAYNNANNTYNAAKASNNQQVMDEQLAEMKRQEVVMNTNRLYKKWEKSGNTVYSAIGESYEYIGEDETGKEKTEKATVTWDPAAEWYTYSWDVDMETVHKSISNKKIGKKVYLVNIPSFDSNFRCKDAEGKDVEQEQPQHYVKTYVFASGDGTYEYYDNYGNLQTKVPAAKLLSWDSTFDPANEHKVSLSSGTAPISCTQMTYMQYFKATKWDHLDVYKVAAYYIYLLRFGAVDQVVKNSMMTTEDGKLYYFINYDNDTILGVRNDGYLVYNWDFDRVTFDSSLPGYAFAGSQSVLWNNLEMDDEFMAIVKEIDNAMVANNLLSAKVVLEYFNEKQEGSWSERLYNEQEKIKYLSTVRKDFSTDRYLGFMHGTRHSHRNWWVNHRWELYDAKWSSGLYSMKQMKFIMTFGASQADPKDIMAITAASKYHFTMVRNTKVEYADWVKEIAGGHSDVFTSRTANSVGDPIYVYGPQKIKVLNLRPAASSISVINLAEPYTITTNTAGSSGSITSNWVDDDGTLMTKLLIGNSDTEVSATAVDINGLGKLISLEELDIRGMQKLNGQCPVISELTNLHRYRAYNSNTTKFDPAPSSTFYEVSLGDDTQAINMTNVTFKADPNEYEPIQTDIVSGNTSIGADLANRVGDYLPDYTGMADAFKYCYTVNEETHEMVHHTDYVFRYTPTAKLSSVTFDNVVGLDTYKFLLDWDNANQLRLRPGSVKATGVNWVLTDDGADVTDGMTAVEKLIYIYNKLFYRVNENGEVEGNKDNLKGKIYIKKANNETLNESEYDTLINTFGSDVFNNNANLMVDCAAGVFVNVKGYSAKKTGGSDTGTMKDKEYYELVQGNTLEINFAKFPISEGQDYLYCMKYNENAQSEAPTWPIRLTDNTKGHEVYEVIAGGQSALKLVNNEGKATLWANPNYQVALDGFKIIDIDIIGYDNNGNPDPNENISLAAKKTVYVKLIERVMPKDSHIVVKDASNETIPGVGADTTYKVTSSDIQEITVKYEGVENVNVKVTGMKVSFSPEATPLYNLGNRAQIVAYESGENSGKYAIINDEDHEYKFRIKNNIIEYATLPQGNRKVQIHITLTYENGETIAKTIEYEVVCKRAEAIMLYNAIKDEESGKWIIDQESAPIDEILVDGKKTYKYILSLGDTNINYRLSITSKPNRDWLSITLEDNELTIVSSPVESVFISPSDNLSIRLNAVPDLSVGDFITEINKEVVFMADVRYPDKLELVSHDVENNNKLLYVNAPNFWTYDDNTKFIVNLTNGQAIKIGDYTSNSIIAPIRLNFVLSSNNMSTIDHNTGNYPYAIEITKFKLKKLVNDTWVTDQESGDNPLANNNSWTCNDTDGGSITLSYTSNEVDLSSDVVIETQHYKSIDGLFITSNAVTDVNSETKICVTCKVRYDIDTLNTNGEVYGKFGNNNSTEVTFEFDVLRSRCVATRWNKLEDVDTSGKYYVVDKNNRFFEILYNSSSVATDASDNKYVKDEYISNIKNSGVSSSDWCGIGFITNGKPIFVSLKSYYKALPVSANITITGTSTNRVFNDTYKSSSNTQNDLIEELPNNMYTSGSSKYNGYEITSTFYNIQKKDVIPGYWSIFGNLYKDNDGKLYVPSIIELRQLVNANSVDGNTLTVGHIDNINVIMNTLVAKCNFAYSREYDNGVVSNTIIDGSGIESNFFDLYKNIQLSNATIKYINYLTSTIGIYVTGGAYRVEMLQAMYENSSFVLNELNIVNEALTASEPSSSTNTRLFVILPFVHVL